MTLPFVATEHGLAITLAPAAKPVVPRTFRDFYAFEQHVKTCRAARGLGMVPQWYEVPVFYFSNPTCLVADGAVVKGPAGCQELDYELELACVIGIGGRDISRDRWQDHVAGFCVLNDFSARDIQRQEVAVGLGPAKAKDFATAIGPHLTQMQELQDVIVDGRLRLEMTARVNGRELSRGNSASMHYSWGELIERASRDVMLWPGDVIGSGTVGTGCILELTPAVAGGWLKPGDVVELEIERLGKLRNTIA
jgi:fumarylacetoacetate (FAA) hydrolase